MEKGSCRSLAGCPDALDHKIGPAQYICVGIDQQAGFPVRSGVQDNKRNRCDHLNSRAIFSSARFLWEIRFFSVAVNSANVLS